MRIIVILLALFGFNQSSAFATDIRNSPPSTEDRANCRQTLTFQHSFAEKCPEHWRNHRADRAYWSEVKQNYAQSLTNATTGNVQNVNIDAGAQCAVANTLGQAVSVERWVLRAAEFVKTETNRRIEETLNYGRAPMVAQQTAISTMTRYASCVRDAQRRRLELPAADLRCRSEAQVNPEVYNRWTNEVRGNLPMLHRNSDRSQERLDGQQQELRRLIQTHREFIRDLDREAAIHTSRISELNTQRAPIAERYHCASPSEPEAPRFLNANRAPGSPSGEEQRYRETVEALRRNSTRLEGVNNVGTGFYAETVGPDGTRRTQLVTANHVPAKDFNNPFDLRHSDLEVASAGRSPSSHSVFRTEVEPGMYDRGNDVVMRPAPDREGLRVAPANSIPTDGQEFIMGGHPGINNTAYTNMRCTFAGYSAENGHYVMNCPTGNQFIGGMSGGPVVDARTGQVWGVITQQGAVMTNDGFYRDERVFVTPIQNGPNGQIVIGQQNTFLSNQCHTVVVTAGSSPTRRCQVLPTGVNGSGL